ncbi:hypothetical protein PIB30_077184 [Stylosanthes scabra]|uniref:TF-B3 domain-containing protein n=1 Tax=Stylosanthes scabra TaxID=79078 RepID=A0ABU6US98_9FABA|nr:hypothetical protein [Stylosanthes scabra]
MSVQLFEESTLTPVNKLIKPTPSLSCHADCTFKASGASTSRPGSKQISHPQNNIIFTYTNSLNILGFAFRNRPSTYVHLCLTWAGNNCFPNIEDDEDIHPDPSNPVCVVPIRYTTLLRTPNKFSIDIPLAHPAKWTIVTPIDHFHKIWGPVRGDSEITHISNGWEVVCDANGLRQGSVIGLEILSICRRILRMFVPDSIPARGQN